MTYWHRVRLSDAWIIGYSRLWHNRWISNLQSGDISHCNCFQVCVHIAPNEPRNGFNASSRHPGYIHHTICRKTHLLLLFCKYILCTWNNVGFNIMILHFQKKHCTVDKVCPHDNFLKVLTWTQWIRTDLK